MFHALLNIANITVELCSNKIVLEIRGKSTYEDYFMELIHEFTRLFIGKQFAIFQLIGDNICQFVEDLFLVP